MEKLHTVEVDELFEAILSLKTVDECYKFFEDICTVKEILDISQRLKAAKMLKSGANYMDISKATGMSTATISRVNRAYLYGAGGYKRALEAIAGEDE